MKVIDDLNLEAICIKLMDKKEGLAWSKEKALLVLREYKRFLKLCKKYENTGIVPPLEVDKFWHYHILDTLKYEKDCKDIFGYFLHHFPYFGMRGDEDYQNLQNAWAKSCDLYIQEFGLPDSKTKDMWSEIGRCPNCGRRDPQNTTYSEQRPAFTA